MERATETLGEVTVPSGTLVVLDFLRSFLDARGARFRPG